MIHLLKYGNTNTYLIKGNDGYVLFDTDWAGTFPLFCKALKEISVEIKEIKYILISHFHPDHMGLAGELSGYGPKIVVMDVQKDYVHAADGVFQKEKNPLFQPVKEENTITLAIPDSRKFLKDLGIMGEILYTPGHSKDSISLFLDEGSVFVGDLNPLYELKLLEGTGTQKSWNAILAKKPKHIYYGHARAADLSAEPSGEENGREKYRLVKEIMHLVDKGYPTERIVKKTGADAAFTEDVIRMYLTHQNVGVQGILDRIEIKNR